jgi:hypothetical protein
MYCQITWLFFVFADSVTRANPFVKAQSWRQVYAASLDSEGSFSQRLRRWERRRAAIAVVNWATSSAVTVSLETSVKVGSMVNRN